MHEAGLKYNPLRVYELFAPDQYYMIPKYQRNFSWTDENISALMNDLIEAWDKFPDEAYLLGQIIVCPATERNKTINDVLQMDLIDGQQRCTTLYLFILIAAQFLDDNPPEKLTRSGERAAAERIARLSIVDSSNDTIEHPRIKVAANGQKIILNLLQREVLPSPEGPTQENIISAVEVIRNTLENLEIKPGSTLYEEIKSFHSFVLNNVFVVRLALESHAHALRVFQKVNNRGLQLDDADLIKNYLFQKVSDAEYSRMSELWESATNHLYQGRLKRVKSMEFLMKALIGIRTGLSIPTGKLYTTWTDLLKNSDEVKTLAEKLPENANYLKRISYGQLPNSAAETDISTGIYLQKFVQPFEILLAGCHLDEKSYKILLTMVEDRTMLSYWANEPSQTFERIVHPWAQKINQLDSNPSKEAIISTGSGIFTEFSFTDLSSRAFLGLQKLDYSISAHNSRIRYALARVNRRIHANLNVAGFDMAVLMKTTRGETIGYDLDHIFPKSSRQESLWKQNLDLDEKFGNASRYLMKINSIGNLTLLHPRDNRDQSDSLPWEENKLTNFARSELLVNRLLAPDSMWSGHQDAIVQKSLEYQKQYSQIATEWGEVQIDERARFYWDVIVSEIRENLGIRIN
jgi:hypothetical protein